MMNKKELKGFISEAFKQGNYCDGFHKLLSLPHFELASLLNKNKWLEQLDISNYFWDEYCLEHHTSVFSCPSSETILNWYFKCDNPNSNLEEILVETYPYSFVKAIKRNRVFIDNASLNRIRSYKWSEEFSADILAWIELNKEHHKLQNEIAKTWDAIQLKNETTLLSAIVYCIDNGFLKNYTDANHEALRQVYNYALSYSFSKFNKIHAVNEAQFDEEFIKVLGSPEIIKVAAFLNKAAEWINFESTVFSSYCFDDNFYASLKEGGLSFNFKSEKQYETWKRDTERYLINNKRYFVEAIQIYNHQEEAGELDIPSGRNEVDENINHTLYVKNWQSILFLQDLSIRNLIFKGRSVHVSRFLSGLMSFAINRQFRYVEPMRISIKQGENWLKAYISNLQKANNQGVSNSPMPYIYLTQNELVGIYKSAIPELEANEIQDLINHFSYTLQCNKRFDPFLIKYAVVEAPFLKLGDYVFTATSFFATNDWFYSIAQRALYLYTNNHHNNERNETAAIMEQELGNSLSELGFKVKVISDKEASKIDGDIDIFVNDGKSQLLIQLKRTKFKLDLASDYKDALETDLKARGQLNEAVEFLKLNPIDGMEILPNHKKWVVTTSFEGLLSEVDDCVKVNYFDLLWALKHMKFSTISELIEYIKADRPFLDCRHYLDLEF